MTTPPPPLPVDPLASPPAGRPVLPPIPRWKIATGATVVFLLTAGAVVALWWAGTRGLEGKDLVAARLDALKTGLSVGVGGGGLFALYLAWRRQRSTEADLDNRERTLAHTQQVAAQTQAHQERVASATEANAEAQRITDLYTTAVEQLGHEKAPVRLGGLYALERLAQDHPDQQQTIVNVLCAYLRMPYTLPSPPADTTSSADSALHSERVQEREVRLTAQRILTHHLRPGDDPGTPDTTFWVDIDINLTAATLIDLDFSRTTMRDALFEETQFSGDAWFGDARFLGKARFDGVQFHGDTRFNSAQFHGDVTFGGVQFHGDAWFDAAQVGGIAYFDGTQFHGEARFNSAQVGDDTWFNEVQFHGNARFVAAQCHGKTKFNSAQFHHTPRFEKARSHGGIEFNSVCFASIVPVEIRRFLPRDS